VADDNPRIEELRHRLQKDPASIAFAHLAEEHRRAGDHHEAVRVCRAGLEHHPAYLSAHVTLGRALMDLEQYPEARTEFEYVLRVAPDNLVALKSMTELQLRCGETPPTSDPALEELQGWMARIQADRAERADSRLGGSASASAKATADESQDPPY
jgi:tetratricopeptide (TPR) repeat protein